MRLLGKNNMGYKSRSGFIVNGCIGCLDINSKRCKNCLGRSKDKRRKRV